LLRKIPQGDNGLSLAGVARPGPAVLLKVRAKVEHRLGEVLRETVNHQGSQGQLKGNTVLPQERTTPEGISKMQSSRAQQVASIPWHAIEEKIDEQTKAKAKASLTRIVADLKPPGT